MFSCFGDETNGMINTLLFLFSPNIAFFLLFCYKTRLISAVDNLLRTLAHETPERILSGQERIICPQALSTLTLTHLHIGQIDLPPGIHHLIPLPSRGKQFDNQSLPGVGNLI